MTNSPLVQQLADTALRTADHPAHAVRALILAAASILERDLGPERTADTMLQMFGAAHEAFASAGLIATPTQH